MFGIQLPTLLVSLLMGRSCNFMKNIFFPGCSSKLSPAKARSHLESRSWSDPSPSPQAAAAGRTRRALPVETRMVRKAATAGRCCSARTQQRRRAVCAAAWWPTSPCGPKTVSPFGQTSPGLNSQRINRLIPDFQRLSSLNGQACARCDIIERK